MKPSILILAACSLSYVALARAADPYAEPTTIPIGGEGRWDYATVDSDAHRLYVTRSTHTQAIDVNTGKVVLEVKGQQQAHGVALVDKLGRGYITDGRAGTIVAFDPKTGETLASIPAADDADGLIYDPGTNKILAGCGDAGALAVLDAAADPKTAKASTVELGGKPEFLAADGKGMAYVNLEDKSQVAVVDLNSMKTIAHWGLGSGESPAGLAIDAGRGRLFVGCHNQKLIVLDSKEGKVLAELPIGAGNDACAFDPGASLAFASCGDGTLTVIKETSPNKFEVMQTVKTPRGARTMAVDPATHILYLPTAELEPLRPNERRPTPKPDSFMIAVVKPTAP